MMAFRCHLFVFSSIAFLILFSSLSPVDAIVCYQCYGAQCFNETLINTTQCIDKCFIGFKWFDNTTLMKGCLDLSKDEVHVYLLCEKDYCNNIEHEVTLACFSCDWTNKKCRKQAPCLRPQFQVRNMCYTAMDHTIKMFKYGCLGDLDEEERRYYFHVPANIEICDNHLCNDGEFKFFTEESFKGKMTCKDTNDQDVNCILSNHKHYTFCYYIQEDNSRGCLTDLVDSLIDYQISKLGIQICNGPLCNKNIKKGSATRCKDELGTMVLCTRYEDKCTIEINVENDLAEAEYRGCYFTPKGFCSSFEECQTVQSDVANEVNVRRMCHVCDGYNCYRIRPTSVSTITICPNDIETCFQDRNNNMRGCGKDGAYVCDSHLCNKIVFGALCMSCDNTMFWCPVPDRIMDVIFCPGPHECMVQFFDDGSVSRDCSHGYVPNSIFCFGAICNSMPAILSACYVYFAKIRDNYNLIRPVEKDWTEHSCPRVSDRPLCYLLIGETFVEGGCSAFIEDYLPKLTYGWDDNNIKYIFCDEPHCNYNQVLWRGKQ